MVVDATPQDHPDRAGRLNNLGIWLSIRFDRTGSIDDLNYRLSSCKEGWPFSPKVSPRSLNHTDKQHMLAGFGGLALVAAATALNAGKAASHALQLLELGRGVIAGLLTDMCRDISDLKREPGIRTQPGFERFPLPLAEDEIMAAADSDPIIVINLSSWRCDAFLIEHSQITDHDLRLSRATSSFHIIPLLEWLWNTTARPNLNALGFKDPVSDDNQRPLHAAGLYVRGSTETVLDKMLKNLCRPLKLWSLTPIMRKDNVLQHLQTCKIFHLAGHGQLDPAEPSQSCLLLEDWKTNPLTENGPFLGYLSACSTGSNPIILFKVTLGPGF
ncbi:hypothetical protein B0T26DRAFT_808792 [Lasiosphaeria miniovina]|uniref:CHAT domain-containing protein n=1 Tax=Lasiosphaeria miniovina TaxID=1954250 RepID=A0AA40EBV5_9PEZI|nr:uncharacterized protein B0T26DRAFT_808792 [Lasiosphaeria miniovina]KAK0734270.1 hypothetical protein B0T26DRAFT_808792 [Lasiosphaeria miniovina]